MKLRFIGALSFVLSSGCLFIASTSPAYAYLDPGSGAIILQVLAAAFFGGLLYFRKFLDGFLNLFKRKSKQPEGMDK